jgi:hypothetical protein
MKAFYSVYYHKFCTSCFGYNKSPYMIMWKDTRELFDDDDENQLNSETEVIPLIASWLCDTKKGCERCGSYDQWKIWDVRIDDTQLDFFKIKTKEKEEIQMLKKTAKEVLDAVVYSKLCGICNHDYEEEIMYYPDSLFYYEEGNDEDLFGRRVMNEVIKDARQKKVECPQCKVMSNNYNIKVTDTYIRKIR